MAILDCDAERLSLETSLERIEEIKPRIVCFVVYGQNPNSGTTSMIGATALAAYIRENSPQYSICFVGSHTSVLPNQAFNGIYVDSVIFVEKVYVSYHLSQLT